jgi:hypothetical protein
MEMVSKPLRTEWLLGSVSWIELRGKHGPSQSATCRRFWT